MTSAWKPKSGKAAAEEGCQLRERFREANRADAGFIACQLGQLDQPKHFDERQLTTKGTDMTRDRLLLTMGLYFPKAMVPLLQLGDRLETGPRQRVWEVRFDPEFLGDEDFVIASGGEDGSLDFDLVVRPEISGFSCNGVLYVVSEAVCPLTATPRGLFLDDEKGTDGVPLLQDDVARLAERLRDLVEIGVPSECSECLE